MKLFKLMLVSTLMMVYGSLFSKNSVNFDNFHGINTVISNNNTPEKIIDSAQKHTLRNLNYLKSQIISGNFKGGRSGNKKYYLPGIRQIITFDNAGNIINNLHTLIPSNPKPYQQLPIKNMLYYLLSILNNHGGESEYGNIYWAVKNAITYVNEGNWGLNYSGSSSTFGSASSR